MLKLSVQINTFFILINILLSNLAYETFFLGFHFNFLVFGHSVALCMCIGQYNCFRKQNFLKRIKHKSFPYVSKLSRHTVYHLKTKRLHTFLDDIQLRFPLKNQIVVAHLEIIKNVCTSI